jgi:hypothetical protein
MTQDPSVEQRKQSILRRAVTALLAIGLGLIILATVFGDPWTSDSFWDPIRADARWVGAIAIVAGVLGWLYLAVPRIGADIGKLWRRSKVGSIVILAISILLAAELVRFNLVRIEGAPLFFVIFLSLILLLGCKILLEIALAVTKFLDPVTRSADEKHVRPVPRQ